MCADAPRFLGDTFAERLTPHLMRLIAKDPTGPVARQFRATAEERRVLPYELDDPLGEADRTVAPRLVRKYENRALLLVTDECLAHCRYCFRRGSTGRKGGAISETELAAALSYLERRPEIDELLLSGGDPLALRTSVLSSILNTLRTRIPRVIIRICTRVPGVSPSRIDTATVDAVRSSIPAWLVVHVNHPDELTGETREAFERFVDAGIPVVVQTVLLRGINDSVDVLGRLFEELLRIRVQPYQLFQADLARGTSHFRVPLERGLAIYRALRSRVSTLALPVYALDAPGGGGKIALDGHAALRNDGASYVIAGSDGREYRYPRERENGRGR